MTKKGHNRGCVGYKNTLWGLSAYRIVAEITLIAKLASGKGERKLAISLDAWRDDFESDARLPAAQKVHGFRFIFLKESPRPLPRPPRNKRMCSEGQRYCAPVHMRCKHSYYIH